MRIKQSLKNVCRVFLPVFVLFSASLNMAYAQDKEQVTELIQSDQYKSYEGFDWQAFKAGLIKIHTLIDHTTPDRSTLFEAMHSTKQLEREVAACIRLNQEQLKKLGALLGSNGIEAVFKEGRKPYEYLQREKKQTTIQLGYCEYYSYQLQELQEHIGNLLKKRNLQNVMSLYPNALDVWHSVLSNPIPFGLNVLYQYSGLNALHVSLLPGFFVVILLAFGVAFYVGKRSHSYLKAHPSQNFMHIFLSTLVRYRYLLFPAVFFDIYLTVVVMVVGPLGGMALVVHLLTVYVLLLFFIKCFFNWILNSSCHVSELYVVNVFYFIVFIFSYVYVTAFIVVGAMLGEIPLSMLTLDLFLYVMVFFRSLLFIYQVKKQPDIKSWLDGMVHRLAIFGFILVGLYLSSDHLTHPDVLHSRLILVRMVLSVCLNLSLLWLLLSVLKLSYFKKSLSIYVLYSLKTLLIIACVFGVLLSYLGIIPVASTLMLRLVTSIIILMMSVELSKHVRWLYICLNNPDYMISKKIHDFLGVRAGSTIPEFFILRITLNVGALLLFIFGLMEVVGHSTYQVALLISEIQSGTTIFGVKLYFGAMLRSINLFFLVLLFGRFVATYLTNRGKFLEDRHLQIAIRSLLRYVFFAVAIIIGLSNAGMGMSRLVVVASALSVGLGFGLQNFVSDFMSGLSLMFNKTIKIGDHVLIEGTEGFVKKIGALSTQVRTLTQSDVIIPNSKLIQDSVINYTFHDNRISRLSRKLVLDDIKDVEKAQQILLGVAQNNPNVIDKPPNQPVVFFDLSSVELWFSIYDVDKKPEVLSELNFAIIHALNEQNVKVHNMPSSTGGKLE